MVYEKQCRWFNLPFPFNDHFNLHGHIIIENSRGDITVLRTGLHLVGDTESSSVGFTRWLTLKSQPQVLSQNDFLQI